MELSRREAIHFRQLSSSFKPYFRGAARSRAKLSHGNTSYKPECVVLNSELPHLVNEIQTQLLWLKPISTPEWLELCRSWTYSCQITLDISSRCILRYPRTVNNIIKPKR